jgi:hypothetical protein
MAADPTLMQELMSRVNYTYDPLRGQDTTPDFTAMDKYRKPSIWEKLAGYGGAALSTYTMSFPVCSNSEALRSNDDWRSSGRPQRVVVPTLSASLASSRHRKPLGTRTSA